MLRDGSVELENVWKRFRTDDDRGLAQAEFKRLRARRRGDTRTGWRWVLRDISLSVGPGETLAVLGTNGSGKSTLLKIIASMMVPSVGRADTRGSIGSLIDVRAGIHPELTGRENIYLYSKMLGLDRAEIDRRFDGIVEFAGIGAALDRQVKHYSSGMALRLGFTVVSHSAPDILIVDEALSVGDAVFRRRCLDHIGELVADGTTLIYVSHELETVEAVCRRSVWIHEGSTRLDGTTQFVLAEYREHLADLLAAHSTLVRVNHVGASPDTARAGDTDIAGSAIAESDAPTTIEIEIESDITLMGCTAVVGIGEDADKPILLARAHVDLADGVTSLSCRFGTLPLAGGTYRICLSLTDADEQSILAWGSIGRLQVIGPSACAAPTGIVPTAPIHVPFEVSTLGAR